MSIIKYVREDKVWSSDAGENAQYQRIARAWNAIHVTLADRAEAACTSVLDGRLMFFAAHGKLFLYDDFQDADLKDGLDVERILSLALIDGQSEDDLAELAESMESWLADPQFFIKGPDVNPVNDVVLEELRGDVWTGFEKAHLTMKVPASLLSRFVEPVAGIVMPESMDFRA